MVNVYKRYIGKMMLLVKAIFQYLHIQQWQVEKSCTMDTMPKLTHVGELVHWTTQVCIHLSTFNRLVSYFKLHDFTGQLLKFSVVIQVEFQSFKKSSESNIISLHREMYDSW